MSDYIPSVVFSCTGCRDRLALDDPVLELHRADKDQYGRPQLPYGYAHERCRMRIYTRDWRIGESGTVLAFERKRHP